MNTVIDKARRRFLCFLSACVLALACFSAPVVSAEDPQGDTAIQGDAGEVYSDGNTSGDSYDENGSESESNVATEIAPECGEGPEAEPVEVAEPETEPGSEPEAVRGAFGLGGSEFEENEIFSFKWANKGVTYFLETGANPAGLPLAATAEGYLNWWQSVECGIHWHYDDVDPDTPGRYQITGDIVLPDGYASSCEPVAQNTVIVYTPDNPPAVTAAWVIHQSNGPIGNRIIPLGTSGDDLEAFFDNTMLVPPADLTILTEYGDACDGVLTGWDTSLVDTSTAGTYYPFFIEPPPGVGLPEGEGPGAEVMGAEVYVLDPDVVCLFAMDYDPYAGFLSVRWLKEIRRPELWLSMDGGAWSPLYDEYQWGNEEVWRSDISGYPCDRLAFYFNSNDSIFQSGHVYELQVRYENGGVSTDTLIVDYTNGKPKFTALGGDRTGGDRSPGGEVSLPADPTPANPAPPWSGTPANRDGSSWSSSYQAASQALPFDSTPETLEIRQTNAETVPTTELALSPTAETTRQLPAQYTTLLTGAQFSALIKANTPHLLLMGEDGLRLWLPRSEALAFGEVDSFVLHLYMPTLDSVRVGFWINGVAFTGAFTEPFVIGIPWEQGEASAADESGAAVPCTYNQADGFLLLTLHKPGTYTITTVEGAAVTVSAPVAEVPASTAVPMSESDKARGGVIPMASAGIAVAGGAGAFTGFKLRGRKAKR